MNVRVGLLILAAGTLVGCGGGETKRQAEACAAAWQGGVAAVSAQVASLEEAGLALDQRRADAQKAAKAIEKRLAALTIQREDAVGSYPDRIKARVASAKMRLATIQPDRDESARPLAAVRFEAEIQGDYRSAARTVAALFEQPKAFFIDRMEVNITDDRQRWSRLKVRFHVYRLTEPAPLPPEDPGLPAGYAAVLAWTPPAGCASSPVPPALESARERLRGVEALAREVRKVEAIEEIVRARTAIADELVRRRDDDRAAWTSRSDELVEKAKKSVTGLAELRFNAKGEPEWKP